MYTNIPTDVISNIITEVLNKLNTKAQITRELILIINTILVQNYFKFNNQFFQQTEGLPMGAPTSSILSEIFLQYIERINIVNILSKFHIENYNRYVDDILIIYNKTKTNIQEVLEEFNKIHHNLQFTLELENNYTINFLDVSILRKDEKLEFNIYRKPTITSRVIHASSCHPN
jgi:hypothetical protein